MEWKTIEKWDNIWAISEDGQLKNLRTGYVKKITPDREGYIRYVVSIKNKSKFSYAHRLVAEAFVTNPDPVNFTVVHHKNNIRDDNRVENLEWCTQKYNRQFAYVTCPCCGTKIKV